MGKRIGILILTVSLVGLLVAAAVFYENLGKDLAPDQLVIQTQPPAQTVTEPTQPPAQTVTEPTQPQASVPETTAPAETTEPPVLAPDFTVYDREGNPHRLSDYFGKPIVLNFWASWCGPCQMEMPDFQEKYLEVGEEVQFLMVNLTDGYRETVEVASGFIESQGYTFPVLFDTASEAAQLYGVYSIPTTYFIDAKGQAIGRAQGAINVFTLQRGIDAIS